MLSTDHCSMEPKVVLMTGSCVLTTQQNTVVVLTEKGVLEMSCSLRHVITRSDRLGFAAGAARTYCVPRDLRWPRFALERLIGKSLERAREKDPGRKMRRKTGPGVKVNVRRRIPPCEA